MTDEELKLWNFKIGDLNKVSLIDVDIQDNTKFANALKKVIAKKVTKENAEYLKDKPLSGYIIYEAIEKIKKEFPKSFVEDFKKGIFKEEFDDGSENLNFSLDFAPNEILIEKEYDKEIYTLSNIAEEYIILNVFKLYITLLKNAKKLDEDSQYFVLSNSDISVLIDIAIVSFERTINNCDYNKVIKKVEKDIENEYERVKNEHTNKFDEYKKMRHQIIDEYADKIREENNTNNETKL